jgi:hypothetical protein
LRTCGDVIESDDGEEWQKSINNKQRDFQTTGKRGMNKFGTRSAMATFMRDIQRLTVRQKTGKP